jgi:hypothetical protein
VLAWAVREQKLSGKLSLLTDEEMILTENPKGITMSKYKSQLYCLAYPIISL